LVVYRVTVYMGSKLTIYSIVTLMTIVILTYLLTILEQNPTGFCIIACTALEALQIYLLSMVSCSYPLQCIVIELHTIP